AALSIDPIGIIEKSPLPLVRRLPSPTPKQNPRSPTLPLQHHRRNHYKFPRMVTENPFWQDGRAVTKLCYSKKKSETEATRYSRAARVLQFLFLLRLPGLPD